MKVLHSICQQIWNTHSGHRTGKGRFSFQSQRKRILSLYFVRASSLSYLVAQLVKNPLAMPESWVQCLDWEDPLEK